VGFLKKEKVMKTIGCKRYSGLMTLFFAITLSMTGCASSGKLMKSSKPSSKKNISVENTFSMADCNTAGVLTKSFEPSNIMHFSEIKKRDKTEILNNIVVYVNPGDTLPLALSMDSDFMAFKQDHIDIVVKEKIYFMTKWPEDLTATELKKLKEKEFFKVIPIYLS
jgi:hypothetical protein